MKHHKQDLQRGYDLLVEIFSSISTDCIEDLERIRKEGQAYPMSATEVRQLLGRCLDSASRGAHGRGDHATAQRLDAEHDAIMARVLSACMPTNQAAASAVGDETLALTLQGHEGAVPHHVLPTPVFHDRRIPVTEGFVDVQDIRLSSDNKRLKIHVEQFAKSHGRPPGPEDLVSMMSSQANLLGLSGKDEFEIVALAQSIAAGGVRQPPIISYAGKLLDGNRRVAACLHVLNSDKFRTDEKARARKIRIWQLAEHATSEDQRAVVIALNFEPDQKVEWPAYIKGRTIYDEWRAVMDLQPNVSVTRQREITRELAKRFAITTERVNRYIEMVKLAEEFEEHHTNLRNRDTHEVQHKSSDYFEYFDELGKGRSPGGVNHTINSDDTFRSLVFDLLYDDKFRNFAQIRGLRYVPESDEWMALLREARDLKDLEEAQERVQDALDGSRASRATERKMGGNKRIESFVKWLRQVPVEFFSVGDKNAITEANLRALHRALKLVEGHLPTDLRNDSAKATQGT